MLTQSRVSRDSAQSEAHHYPASWRGGGEEGGLAAVATREACWDCWTAPLSCRDDWFLQVMQQVLLESQQVAAAAAAAVQSDRESPDRPAAAASRLFSSEMQLVRLAGLQATAYPVSGFQVASATNQKQLWLPSSLYSSKLHFYNPVTSLKVFSCW